MKRFLAVMAVFGILSVVPPVAIAEEAPTEETAVNYLPREVITVETQGGQDYIFEAEMATEEPQQSRGLMYRTQLNNDSGMLFLFPEEEKRTFWMKDTLIPLDMLFIGHDGTIRHIHHNAKAQDETLITSEWPALAVLEINGGLAGTLGIKEGDRILHPAFRNVVASPQ